MKELVVISGKGGTGKTSLTAAFATLAGNAVLCDADVDAADLHLLMAPEIRERHSFKGGGIAVINHVLCNQCGICREKCRWNAIDEDYHVDKIECEGCGVCVWMCPMEAVSFEEKVCGEWFISQTRTGPMVHARLGIAEENSGRLVTLVREKAKKIAGDLGHQLIITDGPPGIGCPVIASLGGARAVLIVTEPTVSGLHDMERVAQLASHFRVPAMLCVNKYDLNLPMTEAIEQNASGNGIKILERIPFDESITRAMVQGRNIIEHDGASAAGQAIKKIWMTVEGFMKT